MPAFGVLPMREPFKVQTGYSFVDAQHGNDRRRQRLEERGGFHRAFQRECIAIVGCI